MKHQSATKKNGQRAYVQLRDRVEKIIRFTMRSYEELVAVMARLRVRYRSVRLERKLVAGMFQGKFIVSM